jgi:methyltransferase (TIGR00027 family)
MDDPRAIRDVSDTALWVAEYRAMETERPDACFRDPFARRLAGERGRRIVNELPRGRASAWAIVARTYSLDQMITDAVDRGGVDRVVNLAAGLDTRPYRMRLPASLRWIEVDFPKLLSYKAEKLRGEKPVCEVETVGLDLADRPARRALFARVNEGARRVLVITEGLLPYLAESMVEELAADLYEQPSFHWWLTDIVAREAIMRLQRLWARHLAATPFRFAPAEGSAFFLPLGFREVEFRSQIEDVLRIDRAPWFIRLVGWSERFMDPQRREQVMRMSGVVRLERIATLGTP